MSDAQKTPAPQTSPKAPGQQQPEQDRSLNTSVTEDDRTEGGPVDESGDPKLDTTNDI